jgi:hypothetical protein
VARLGEQRWRDVLSAHESDVRRTLGRYDGG